MRRAFYWSKIAEVLVFAGCCLFLTWKAAPLLAPANALITNANRAVVVTGGEEARFWKQDWPEINSKAQADLTAVSTTLAALQPIEAQLTFTASKLNAEADALHEATVQTTATLAQGSATLAGVKTNLDDLTASATDTLDATTEDLKQFKADEISANKAVADFDELYINSAHAMSILGNLDTTSLHVANISKTTDEWWAKVTQCRRHPTFACVTEGYAVSVIEAGAAVKTLSGH